MRAYTFDELSDLREALRESHFNYGYSAGDLAVYIQLEELTRTNMLAGKTAAEVRTSKLISDEINRIRLNEKRIPEQGNMGVGGFVSSNIVFTIGGLGHSGNTVFHGGHFSNAVIHHPPPLRFGR